MWGAGFGEAGEGGRVRGRVVVVVVVVGGGGLASWVRGVVLWLRVVMVRLGGRVRGESRRGGL